MNKIHRIAGVDEAGRGPLAGPVVAAAVVFPADFFHPDIKDSKQLSAKKRDSLIELIKREALSYSIIAVGHKRIDQLNIREATKVAMSAAVARVEADEVLIDGNMLINTTLPQQAIVKGDTKVTHIAAASILAKTYRDALMCTLNKKYPGYDLEKHAGYPTSAHRIAIQTLGPSPIHRSSFKGVREFLL
jgi:ribonuclease HII